MWCIKRYFHLFSKNIWYVMDQAPVSGLSLRRLIIEITHRMTLARLKSSPLLVTFKVRVNRRRVHILSNQVHQSDDMCSRLVNFTDIRSPTRFFSPKLHFISWRPKLRKIEKIYQREIATRCHFWWAGFIFLTLHAGRCNENWVQDWSFCGNLCFSSAPDICCAEQIILFNILFIISELCSQ